uniref:Secreted protein n=1 Tax=Ixodes ricinus TaxID=34613 RepID=V5GJK1_IXORI
MMVPCVWIFKVVTLKSSITLGLAETENAFNIKEANIEEVWRKLPETQGQFHDCNPKSNATPVEKCMHICKKYAPNGKYGYFFGIYQDHNPCKLADGKTGECRSGLCVEITGTYPIEN